MDSGFTLDQAIQIIEERQKWIANADRTIQQYEVQWAPFQGKLRLRSELAKEFLREIESYARQLSSEKDDFSDFFNDRNLAKLDELKTRFQKIAALCEEISKEKKEYDAAKLENDAVEELKRRWSAEAREIRLKFFPVNTYNTEPSNMNDNSINGNSTLGSNYL